MEDPYRDFIFDDLNINWRHGAPPNYDDVNKLFREGRTQEWPEGSLEQIVENLVCRLVCEALYKYRSYLNNTP